MYEVADRLHSRPPAMDATEIRPGEIRQKLSLAISTWPKERQRVRRKIRYGYPLRRGIDLIRASSALKDAVEMHGRHASRGRQSPDNVSMLIDEALRRQDRRKFERQLLKHAGSDLRMDVHHGQDRRRRLPNVERDIEAVTDKHF